MLLPEAVAKEVIGLSAAVVKGSRLQLAVKSRRWGCREQRGRSESRGRGLRAGEAWQAFSKAGLRQWLGEKIIHLCTS